MLQHISLYIYVLWAACNCNYTLYNRDDLTVWVYVVQCITLYTLYYRYDLYGAGYCLSVRCTVYNTCMHIYKYYIVCIYACVLCVLYAVDQARRIHNWRLILYSQYNPRRYNQWDSSIIHESFIDRCIIRLLKIICDKVP